MTLFVEIRSYNLKPGTREEFHRLFVETALPMLKRWKVDMVCYGASLHDEDSYYLMRAYASLEGRQQSQDAFYGSDEWKLGPREPIIALIENYTSIVIEMEDSTVSALR
ncbi:MAG TPA: NIPSNAP family protein [Anaerolineales bacterium]|nr:NIPSNAP family protein [Anaerolineales bacterium]